VGSARAGTRRWTTRARKMIMPARGQPAPQRPMSACLDMSLGETLEAFVYRAWSMLTNERCDHPSFKKWASPFVLYQRAVATTSIQAINLPEHWGYDLRRYGPQHALNMLQRKRHIRRQHCLRLCTARAYADQFRRHSVSAEI